MKKTSALSKILLLASMLALSACAGQATKTHSHGHSHADESAPKADTAAPPADTHDHQETQHAH